MPCHQPPEGKNVDVTKDEENQQHSARALKDIVEELRAENEKLTRETEQIIAANEELLTKNQEILAMNEQMKAKLKQTDNAMKKVQSDTYKEDNHN